MDAQDKRVWVEPAEALKAVGVLGQVMVLASGVKQGEIVALSDPTLDKSKKEKGEKKSAANPMGGMPGGK